MCSQLYSTYITYDLILLQAQKEDQTRWTLSEQVSTVDDDTWQRSIHLLMDKGLIGEIDQDVIAARYMPQR